MVSQICPQFFELFENGPLSRAEVAVDANDRRASGPELVGEDCDEIRDSRTPKWVCSPPTSPAAAALEAEATRIVVLRVRLAIRRRRGRPKCALALGMQGERTNSYD